MVRRILIVAVSLGLMACEVSSMPTTPSGGQASAMLEKKRPPTPTSYRPFGGLVSLTPSGWTTTPSWCRPTLTLVGGALVAPIPSSSSCTLNYLYTMPLRIALTTAQSLSVAFAFVPTSGSPTFHYNASEPAYAACAQPVSARLFFWSNGLGAANSDRWWAFGDAVTIAPGSFSVSVPLDPARWLNVNGRHGDNDVPAFTTAIQHLDSLGLTLGGNSCNYGHGVYVQNGTARLHLSRYEVR